MQCFCGYIFKAFAQRCALNLSGEESRSRVCDSELESLYSSLIDNKEILQCFLNLPCCLLNNEKEIIPKKRRKYSTDIQSSAYNGSNYFCDSNA